MNRTMLLISLCLTNIFAYTEEPKDDSELVSVRLSFAQGLEKCLGQNLSCLECEKQVFKFGQRSLTRRDIKLGLNAFKGIYKDYCTTPEDKKNAECTLIRDMYNLLHKKYQSTQRS